VKVSEKWKLHITEYRDGLMSDAERGLIADLAAAEAERERLRAALQRYGRHQPGCTAFAPPSYRENMDACVCGWADVQRKMRKAEEALAGSKEVSDEA
jgi:hypothetical protein